MDWANVPVFRGAARAAVDGSGVVAFQRDRRVATLDQLAAFAAIHRARLMQTTLDAALPLAGPRFEASSDLEHDVAHVVSLNVRARRSVMLGSAPGVTVRRAND